jgi:gliding motility-associated-like protein
MKPKLLLYIIQPIILLTVYCQQIHGQTNPCGVVASIYPAAQDSVVPTNTIINFISTSTNATSVQWLQDGFPWVTGNSLNVSIPPGIIRISLVAYNGNCSDTTTVVYFSAGTAHNIDTMLLAHYGTSRYNEEAEFIEKTVDSGFIVIGTQYKWDPCGEIGVLVKLRDKGCIDWSKKLLQPFYCPSTRITAFHLSSDTNYYAVTSSYELVKLDRNGDLVWTKKYGSNGWPLYFQQMTGDDQGNLYITSWGIQMNSWVLTKVDKNGNVVWNKIFRLSHQMPGDGSGGPPYEFALTTGITFLNGKIYVSANAYTNALGFFTNINRIDPATGSMEWKYGYADAVVGALGVAYLGLYDTLLMASSPGQGQAVTLIDQQGNVRKSISVKFATSHGAKKTKAVANRNGRIYTMQWTEQPLSLQPGYYYYNNFAEIDTALNKYGGLVFDEYYRPWFSDIAVGLDGKPGAVGTHWGLVNDSWGSRDIRFLKFDSMINTNLYCYTYDNSYSVFQNQVSRFNFNYLVDSSAIATEVLHSEISVVDAYVSSRYNCPDFLDSCSFMKLSGPVKLCSFANTYTYKIHRNRACVINPQFQLPAGVIIMNQTDSTISLKFPAFGTYTISAKLNSCIPVKDSLIINIASKSYPLNLGNDTTICAGTAIKLHAAPNFFSYLWNDGSTDSVLNISNPGLYWIETIDSCNNVLRDSITITSFYLPITIGPDRTKCNNDTLHLNGPPGFISYAWSNNYNISSSTSQNTIINPSVDTAYYLKAEKLPGCFSYDTVRVTVFHSPPIDLGADTSICRGDTLLLSAGPGFTQYTWSNNLNSQQVFVSTAGSYSVTAFTVQGCRSSDTLKINQLLPLPVIALNPDPSLCIGDTRVLDAGSGYKSYSWNTGSNSQSITVSNIGQYSVSVIDNNGCKGGDTTMILQMLALPSGFLGPDTAICSYGDLQLKTTLNFNQYTWSNGSLSSFIIIKQPGLYWLRVKDGSGCFGKDSIIVDLKECLKGFFMPTGFTPNNDGKNDLLKPLLLGDVAQYRFWIYNRWGELVFETTDLKRGWNGIYKGQPQNSGVFVWMCQYQFEGETPKQEKGTAVLIR